MYENGAETKNKILNTAVSLFLKKGYDATTYAEISSISGVRQGSIYYHFKKKTELYRQAHQQINNINSKTAHRLCEEGDPAYLPFMLDIYVYWYRFFTEADFRNLMAEGLGIDSPLEDSDDEDSFWIRCSSFIEDYDSFCQTHALEMDICKSIDCAMSVHFKNRTADHTFRAAAEYELRTFALIFHIDADICESAISLANTRFNDSIVKRLPTLLAENAKNI